MRVTAPNHGRHLGEVESIGVETELARLGVDKVAPLVEQGFDLLAYLTEASSDHRPLVGG